MQQAISRANLALHLSPANSYCRLCSHKGPGGRETPDPSSWGKAQRSRRRTPSTMEQRHGRQSALVQRSKTTPELSTSKNAIESLTTSRGVGFKRSTLGQASLVETPCAIALPLHGAVDKHVKDSIATQQEVLQARRYAVE